MEFAGFKKIDHKEIASVKFAYFLTSPVNASDCFYILKNPSTATVLETLSHPFTGGIFSNNERAFMNYPGFSRINLSGGKKGEFRHFLESICNRGDHEKLDILIDYSCMPAEWCAELMDGIGRICSGTRIINTYMVYLAKKCCGRENEPSYGAFSNRWINDSKKPLSLLLGLDSASLPFSALKALNPKEIIAFIPCGFEKECCRENIIKANRDIIEMISSFNIIDYRVDEPEETSFMMTSICLRHRLDSEVAIVPGGPKIFSLLSMLLSMQYPDIKLLELHQKKPKLSLPYPFANRESDSLPVLLRATFCEELEDLEMLKANTSIKNTGESVRSCRY
jgi:hypothetical protein